jgi:pyruvate,orthophosphate dikinase
VGFTRNPATGEKKFYGEFLENAQGEDVVSGVRTPHPISELEAWNAAVYNQLREITTMLEKHYRDVQDFEFTIQDGKLYMLQTRNGKRTGPAAVRIAVDMVEEGLINKQEAILRVEPQQLDQLLHPVLDPASKKSLAKLAVGLPASPGAAVGMIVFTANEAVEASKKAPVILVRKETVPDDIHGMEVAKGILTSRGGMTSHAAVVCRGMGTPCVAGAEALWSSRKATGCRSTVRPVKCSRVKPTRWMPTPRRVSWPPSWAGPMNSAVSSACAPTRISHATPRLPAGSGPRASACAAPSTCSSPRAASSTCRP